MSFFDLNLNNRDFGIDHLASVVTKLDQIDLSQLTTVRKDSPDQKLPNDTWVESQSLKKCLGVKLEHHVAVDIENK